MQPIMYNTARVRFRHVLCLIGRACARCTMQNRAPVRVLDYAHAGRGITPWKLYALRCSQMPQMLGWPGWLGWLGGQGGRSCGVG